MLDKTSMERLAFVKYCYELAVKQSQGPQPLCATSVLTLHDAIDEYDDKIAQEFGYARYRLGLGKSMKPFSNFSLGFDKASQSHDEEEFSRFIENVRDSVIALQDAVKILGLGIDYNRYTWFRFFTDSQVTIQRTTSGEYIFARRWRKPEKNPTTENVQFCIGFVVECALALKTEHMPPS